MNETTYDEKLIDQRTDYLMARIGQRDAVRKYVADNLAAERMRLQHAREAASHNAWVELTELFSPAQRQHLANLLAHRWRIGGVVLQASFGSGAHLVIGEAPTTYRIPEDRAPLGLLHPIHIQALRAAAECLKRHGDAAADLGWEAEDVRDMLDTAEACVLALANHKGGGVDAPAEPTAPQDGGAPREFWNLLHEWADGPNEERREWIEHRFGELFQLARASIAAHPKDEPGTAP